MAQTFVFEELDDATRDYLTAVRDAEGEGAPGVFIPTTSALAGCGCISGLVIVVFTLIATLTTWPADIVYQEPGAVALLQTAGLLLGGWLLVAAVRSFASRKGDKKTAGLWVYADALHLYEAYREQVAVTPLENLVEANFTHNYNNGSYQNSVVRVVLDGGPNASVTISGEAKAEQLVAFLNYLAWARGPEGGERAKFAPAKLGAVAKYVAVHDVEPKNADDRIDMDLVDTGIDAVPEEPAREGRAAPNVLPYIVILLAAVGVFVLMWKVVNPPIRDEAMYEAVMKPDQCVEPLLLRAYLIDDRNTRHRAEVAKRLERIYADAVNRVKFAGTDETLREGFAQVLDSVKGPEQPTVSLKVTEERPRPGAQDRVKRLKDEVVGKLEGRRANANSKDPDWYEARGGIYERLAELMPAVPPPPGMTFPHPRTAVGISLIEFADKPEDAAHAHFEISYEFVEDENPGRYRLEATVEFRTKLDDPPVVAYKGTAAGGFFAGDFDQQVEALKDRLVKGMVGQRQGGGFVPQPGGFVMPPGP